MKPKNPKLMIALGSLGMFVFLGFVFSLMHSGGGREPAANQGGNPNAIAAYDYQSGDTNTEVLDTVVANQKKLEESNAALSAQNVALEKAQTQNDSQNINQVKSSLTSQLDSVVTQLQSEMSAQHGALASSTSTQQNTAGYVINGEGVSGGGSGLSAQGSGGVIGSVDDISQVFVSATAGNAGNGKTNFGNNIAAVYGNGVSSAQKNQAPALPSDVSRDQKKQPTLMYAIPDGSTIGSVHMMTATLAEVPVSGRLIAPAWPFKAIVGDKNLMGTNGHMLPNQIAGAIIQGHAIGNMGLGCATLYVDKITYTFPDGHFWVYPAEGSSQGDDGKQVYPSHSLGLLTLPDGTSCINGLYLTDAPKVLLNLTALGAGSNAGNVMANQQISTVSNGMTGVTGTNITGSAGKLFGWSMLAGGSTAALNYYQARVSDVFDAVFLPASTNHEPTELIFNVQQTIPIKYDPNSVMNASKNGLLSSNNTLD